VVSKLRYTQFYICVCSLAALATLANLNMTSDNLMIVLALAVTFLGLPHGALDFAVAKSLNLVTSVSLAIQFVSIYVVIAALSIIFWICLPGIALVLFLCISVFHFSADWRGTVPLLFRLSLASVLLCGPSVLYSEVVTELFTALLLTSQAANWVIQGMQVTFYAGICIFIYFLIRLSMYKKRPSLWHYTEWLTLLVSSLILTPLLHFGLYFCLLHSPKHLQDVGVKLNVSVKRAIVISLPFVVLTIVAAVSLYGLFGTRELNIDLLRWIFIGLFGLTMSHMILVHLWHSSISD
jgi:Brp/Blh family beta-carotene 15,15'-monooxygenase